MRPRRSCRVPLTLGTSLPLPLPSLSRRASNTPSHKHPDLNYFSSTIKGCDKILNTPATSAIRRFIPRCAGTLGLRGFEYCQAKPKLLCTARLRLGWPRPGLLYEYEEYDTQLQVIATQRENAAYILPQMTTSHHAGNTLPTSIGCNTGHTAGDFVSLLLFPWLHLRPRRALHAFRCFCINSPTCRRVREWR